jgi:hypothetical protein
MKSENPRPGRTRGLLIGGGVAVVCGAIALSGVLTANASPVPTPAAPAPAAAVSAAQVLKDTAAAPADENPNPAPLGAVISSGVKTAGGELVFYGVAINEPALPHTKFGIMAGHRDAAGKVTGDYLTNETSGTDEDAGFHGISGGVNVNGIDVPTFGYYAGPAAKITARIGGKTVQAHQAAWSQDSKIVIFWFDGTAGDPTHVTAFDAAGKELPSGRTGVSHG